MSRDGNGLSSGQQWGLVLLRTLIGWHFLYEGYFKLLHPAWSRAGAPLGDWSSAAYLKAATGPAAALFHAMGASPWVAQLDSLVALSLLLVGLSLLLGLFTDLGCVGGLCLLALFYVSAMPTRGVPEPHSEGAYLFVNKNLIEAAAVWVLLQFRTGRIAGLDRLRGRKTAPAPQEVSV